MNMHSSFRAEDAAAVDARDAGFVRRNLRWLIAIVAVLIGIGAYVYLRGGKAEEKPVEADPTVTVISPGRTPVADSVRVTGSIAARREMPVGVQGEGGMVTAVLVEAGDYVGAGQILARVDRAVQTQQTAAMAAALQQTRADARLAQAELDRALTLVDKGFISKADIDRRTASRDSAAARAAVSGAQLNEMRARLARLDIRAPAAGLVLTRTVEPGQIVSPGSPPLFRIAQGGAMELRAQIAEQDMAKLRVGQPARVMLVGNPQSFDGVVWQLSPTIDPQTRQGVARIEMKRDPAIRVGGFANASVAAGTAMKSVLPQSAVQVDDAGSFVFVVGAGNKIERRTIVTGEIGSMGIPVVSGLTGNERIVASAGAFFQPGDKVAPVLKTAR